MEHWLLDFVSKIRNSSIIELEQNNLIDASFDSILWNHSVFVFQILIFYDIDAILLIILSDIHVFLHFLLFWQVQDGLHDSVV